ncbi:cellulose synthase subunit BcsC-related outer membrane protein [Acidicapsa acidisoli]|uniref:cellulose synthase subunit BcsC-related outer membrane protein n=1 Tax=Acidicapsa acidisoli TaxID=1615681 RepID=UPI0021DF8C27|nr:cellulose synthase subunit BcsC-related outer membrane protein [Acidicapsa acidisoli]
MRRQQQRLTVPGVAVLAASLLLCLLSSNYSASAQAQKQSDAEKTLIEKAQALESRGRPDIAVQVWQQILLSDPNNQMALAGVARDYRLSGNSAASDEALDKLRKINPSDPNISRIQGLTSNKTRDVRLGQAGTLAKAGNPEAAMRIYREYYGDHPPDGDIALAYYETLYATPNGKTEALNAMRALAARNPGDPRFIVTLGRMLTYDARTRAEGIKILHEHIDSSDAQNSLRQALIWDSANPASAAELKEYLRTHPKDTELEQRLKANEGKLAEMNAGIARTPEERAAFAALNAHRLTEAETRFQAMLDKNEKDARAAAGMGFLRMQQSNFGAAISYLEQAEQNGFRDHSVSEGLATSRFWFTMGEASTAFNANQLDVATEKYKAALDMRPRSPEALNGLAGIYTKNQQYPDASAIYQQILKIQPASLDAWRGLFLSYARNNQTQQAMSLMTRFPASVKANLNRDPDYLQTLAGMYQAMGRDADAQKTLAQALALPFPDNGSALKTGTRLQYAGILMSARRYDQAAELYKQVLNDETTSLPAWMGLVTAEHQLQHDNAAIELVEKMPPDTYEAALGDSGFLAMLGSIYQQSNQFEIAQGLLERSVKLQMQAGGAPSLGLQIQLAAIYLQRNNTAQAYALYHQILEAHPDNLDAWRGLIGTMQATHRDAEALEEIKLIPPAVRKQLEADVQFEQSEASLYANAGDTVNAMALFNQVQKHYAVLRQQPPADVEIQNAYLLYNTFNDRALYPALMRLGAREDLTTAQRETIQGLWANWSTRRAATAFDNGNTARAIDILDAAAQAFPDNLSVRKAVAGGYLRVGRAKESLEIFKQIDMQDATAADFQGAIGSALAANDKAQAEHWLRQALDRYPRDSAILAEAARFEQARGDNARAADYWRASLAAMPKVSPTDKLAHELVHPETIKPNSRAATPDDLAHLLNPDQDTARAGKSPKQLPPLPAYGHDPYDPGPPVILNNQQPASGTLPGSMPVYPVPTTTITPLPSSEINPSPAASPTAPAGPTGYVIPPYHPQSSSNRKPNANPATAKTSPGKSATSTSASAKKDSSSTSYSGRIHLPPTEETITSSATASPRDQPIRTQPTPQPAPQPRTQPTTQPVYPQLVQQSFQSPAQTGLRLSSEPMNPVAARAQALLTDETDGQITQGLAAGVIRYLPNAATPGVGLPASTTAASQTIAQNQTNNPARTEAFGSDSNAQYTPSAQDAAAGAYSAQKQATPPAPQPVTPVVPPQPVAQQPTPQLTKHTRKRRKPKPASSANSVPTLVTAPGEAPAAVPQLPVTDAATQGTQSTSNTGLSDQELQERNLPPLKGPWARLTHPQTTTPNPREEAELQLRTIEGGYSPWLGGTGTIAYRTGDPGYNALTSLEAIFEASVPLAKAARLTFIARPAFLDSGQANGSAVIQLTTGAVTASSPEPIGTLTGAAASTTPPAQQNSSGIAGEAQLTFGNLAIAGGYTPYGFLISNWTARASWRPGAGPFTFTFNRDSVKDTQLSYSGLRDPGSITAFNPGNVWGGVIANSGNVQYSRGDLTSGFYLGAGGQYITGFHVEQNKRFDGSAGAYWRVLAMPEYGSLNVGANFFAMHYTYNLQAYTYGMGGYFSPQFYFLANVPITWTGHRGPRLHYTVLGSFGIQAFSEDAEPLDPLDLGIETNTFNNAKLAALTSVGPNYDLRGQAAYGISDHWFVGAFAGANNSRNYTNLTAGFSVRYLFRSQPSTVAGPTGLFQTDDAHALRPLTVP